MKRLTAAFAILMLLLGASLALGRSMERLAEDYTQQLRTAQQLAEQGDWAQARTITQRVYQQWEKKSFFLHALLRHDDTDQILISFRAVEQYLQLQEMDQYAAANATLIVQLELLAEMEQATVENVL